MKEYLEDATPCTECGAEPSELIAQSYPIVICGVSLRSFYGTVLKCPKCGKRTNAFQNPQEAYRDWNENINKGGKCV